MPDSPDEIPLFVGALQRLSRGEFLSEGRHDLKILFHEGGFPPPGEDVESLFVHLHPGVLLVHGGDHGHSETFLHRLADGAAGVAVASRQ